MTNPQLRPGVPALLASRYELDGQLADGAVASVWRGRDRLLARDVAVKVLRPEFAGDPDLRARFRQEAVGAARLVHPGIVAIYDTGEQDDVVYLVLELVDGQPLRELLRAGPLAPAEAARIAREAATVLDYAHARGVIHGDLRPGNILLTRSGAVKLADFSIAQPADAGAPRPDAGLHAADNAAYLAPEQVHGRPVDRRTDVYALGVCLYEMLTGRPPFRTGSSVTPAMAHLQADPLPPRSLRAGLPRPLETIAMRAISKEPALRYPTAAEVAAALARWEAAHTAATGPIRAVPEPDRVPAPGTGFLHGEGRWIAWALVIVGLVAALVVVGLLAERAATGPTRSAGPPRLPRTGEPAPIHVFNAISYDPYGTGAAGFDPLNAIAGPPGTWWGSACYTTAAFGNLKPGLGLVLDAGARVSAGLVRLDLIAGGATVSILGANGTIPARQTGWVPLAPPRTVGATSQIELAAGSYRYYLVWFSRLPYMPASICAGGGHDYQVEVHRVALVP